MKRISETEMLDLLRETYSREPEASLMEQLARKLCDPGINIDGNGRSRIHPVYLTLCLILFFILGVFLYFSFARP